MHLIITDAWLARSRAVHLSGTRLVLCALLLSLALMLVAAGLYHWVFLKGARERWPVVGALVQLVVKDEFDQRDRFMRENLDVLARQVGEMQAKLTQLESLGERVSGLAGLPAGELRTRTVQRGALVSARPLSMDELHATLATLDRLAAQRTDLLTVLESRLFEQKMRNMMIPTQQPVADGNLGSEFGWRIDPITGRYALHTVLTSRQAVEHRSSRLPVGWWIDEDRKATPLKALQGMIWAEGYAGESFVAHVYPDAVAQLRAWHAAGHPIHVYSSGSIPAQQLYFGHTGAGDLRPLFSGWFDTTSGPKRESESYRRIAAAIGAAPVDIVFLSDIEAELDAARAAGMRTWWLRRDGAGATPGNGPHPAVRDFHAIRL